MTNLLTFALVIVEQYMLVI